MSSNIIIFSISLKSILVNTRNFRASIDKLDISCAFLFNKPMRILYCVANHCSEIQMNIFRF